jgi:formate dehydrogenase subunit gamma
MDKQAKQDKSRTTFRRIGWMTLLVFVAALVVPLTGSIHVAMAQAEEPAEQAQQAGTWSEVNPRSETWRQARQSVEGVSAVRGPGANVLMTNSGQLFREVRNGPVATLLPWWLAFMVGAIFLLHLFTGGGHKLGKLSGKRLPAGSLFDRILHWYVAILFLILAITGLSLLFGRAVLIPVLGPEAFAAWARASKFIHDWLGPLFVVGIVVMTVAWLHHNMPTMVDVRWLLKGGAFGKH